MPPNPPMFALHCSAPRGCGRASAVRAVGMACPLSLCSKCQRKPRAGPSTQGLSIGNTYFPL